MITNTKSILYYLYVQYCSKR